MSKALYRKWRPQNFSEICGQNQVKTILQNALSSGRIAHAYLFSGPRGSGKTTIARLVAKSVNCSSFKNGEPCNKCSSCTEIQKGQSLDLIEIDAASNRGIEEIKDLREKIKFTPSSSKYKVFVIDEVHMLTREAFNALLKTLEEPPAHVIFILATTEAHKIPQTIASRCQRFDFKRLSAQDLLKRLDYLAEKENLKIDDGAKKTIIQISYGSARDAESILDLIVSKGLAKITQKDVEEILGKTEIERIEKLYKSLISKDSNSALTILNDITEEGKDLNQFAVNLIEFLREELIKEPSSKLALWIRIFSEAQREMKIALFLQLPLELAIVEICEDDSKNDINKNKKSDKILGSKEESPKSKVEASASSDIDWSEVINKLRPHNHSLCFLLQDAKLIDFKNGQLVLGVGFKFHKDKLEEPKNRKIIEQIVEEMIGQKISLLCQVIRISPKMDSIANISETSSVDNVFENIEGIFELEEPGN
ncbi:MAG: DNA polymerase III subunit gamma/tau [Candidatus Berkelbacteria bacterium]|nr:DNA polymerase III subunit gamma/tau [Candidatus Berkelbacteria bacterium]